MKTSHPLENPADDSGQHPSRDVGGINKEQNAPPPPDKGTLIEQAETRTEQANFRTDQANTRTDEANIRTDEANTRTAEANTRTEQAENREQGMRASELSYRRLFETSKDGILILDAGTGMIVDVNPFLEELLGYSHAVFLGKKVWELGFLKDLFTQQVKFAELQEKEYVRYENLPLETAQGRRIEVEFVSNVYLVNHQKVIQCSIRDITERKQAEAALRWSETQLQVALDSTADGILAVDNEGKVIKANGRFAELWRIPPSLLESRDDHALLAFVLDKLSEPEAFLKKVQALYGTTTVDEDTIAFKDGRVFERHSAPMLMSGVVSGRVWSFRDDTERQRSEQLLAFTAQEGWTGSHEDFFVRLVELIGRTLNVDYAFIGRLKDAQTVQTTGLYAKGRMAPDIEYSTRSAPCHNVIGKMLCHYGEKLQGLFPDDALLAEMGAQSYLGIPLMDSAGKPLGLIAVLDTKPMPDARSATTLLQIAAVRVAGELERQRVEAALQFKNVLLSTQQEASIDGILVVDGNARILSYNRRFNKMWRFPADLVEDGDDEKVLQFVTSRVADAPSFLQRVQYLYAHREETSQEELILTDGRIFDRYSAPMFGPEKHYYGRVWYFRDITERKRAEGANARLSMAVEQAAESVVITDTAANILYANPAFEKTSGYTCAEVLGKNPRLFKSGQQDATFYRQMWDVLKRGEVWRGHFINQRKDGTLYEEDATVSPVRDATGKVVNYVAVKRDVTREMQLEAQFRQSQKMEAIGTLAGGVAHDFNNILAVIQMQASLLKSDGDLSAEQSALADDIGVAVQRAAALTRQLLMFSRKQTMQSRDLDLNESIKEMNKMLLRIIGEHIAMQAKPAARPMFVHADAGMMDQVLLNLAVNARDAMPDGGRLVIETAGVEFDESAARQTIQARPGSFVCLSVSDTGCGIPPENLAKIFEPFFTTRGVGKGTGLGLATVFDIAQQHQGWINVHSEVGCVTVFKVYLPRLTGLTAQKIAQQMLSPDPTGNETILLVDDELPLRIMLRKSLTRLGYRVLEAATGVKALEVWKEHHGEIDLLLTDLMMPDGMTGKELAQSILQENPKLKVVYMSGYSPEILGKDFPLEEGVNFLTKPFPPQKLAQTIRDNLDKPPGGNQSGPGS